MSQAGAGSALPIEAVVPDVRSALTHNSAAVLQAEPGAGKTTIIPLRLLDEPWLAGRKIMLLEPRRLAARAAASRMASLLGEAIGDTVGVVTRDLRRVGSSTRIEVVTEGILTRRLQNDPSLDGFGLVIFDEFHERNIQGDLGLALTLDARAGLGLDLRVLVMSATIDGARVASLLGDADSPAPVIDCEGRTFPIDIQWRPRPKQQRLEAATADAVRWALQENPNGDVLVFLPGMGEIRRTADQLGPIEDVDVHLLHGSLPMADQDEAVAPARVGRRKVVLSTDIAETSLTVEGVRTVVDAGLARAPRFDARTGMTRLVTVSTSRASADQRAGRAGRTAPGMAVRLWSKIEHGTRARFSPAEIAEIDLADFQLELLAWGIGDTSTLRLLDEPPKRTLAEARDLLAMLGAVDEAGALTKLGRTMVPLPLHPRLARMVAGAREIGHGRLACTLAALLDERDVLRGRPNELPADLGLRLELVLDRSRRHPSASGRSLDFVRRRSDDLARRLSINEADVDVSAAGQILALAYPDRVGQRRGSGRGRFRLRSGSGAWVADTDPLAGEEFIVAADLDGKRSDARIRLGAGIDEIDLAAAFGADIIESHKLAWDNKRNDLVLRTERRLGSIELGSYTDRPPPSDEVMDMLLKRVRSTKLKTLTWTDRARSLQARVGFARRSGFTEWPDFSDKALLASLDDWLVPFMPGATGRADLEIVSVAVALDNQLSGDQREKLKRSLPETWTLASGRTVAIDYAAERPTLSGRVQEFFGGGTHPTILDGELPLTVELLSPADRPVQVTSDLPGFWSGSWTEVRKEMAGRYPKHRWPDDPNTAKPGRR